jgi:hypothetical protein
MYYATSYLMNTYYPLEMNMTALTAKVVSEHKELANDSVKMMQYIFLKYPNEMREIFERVIFSYLLQYLLIGLYVIPMTWKYGATLGKKIIGIKVVDLITGGKLTLTQSIIRYIGYLPAVIPFGLGIIWGSFHPRKRCWQDFFGDSIVIYDSNRWYKKYFDKVKAYFNLK